MTRLNSSGLISVNGAKTEVNATFTHTSMGPSSLSARSAACCTASKSATSAGYRQCLAARRFHVAGGARQARLAARDQRDMGPAASEKPRRGAADARAGAGDHDCLGHGSPTSWHEASQTREAATT